MGTHARRFKMLRVAMFVVRVVRRSMLLQRASCRIDCDTCACVSAAYPLHVILTPSRATDQRNNASMFFRSASWITWRNTRPRALGMRSFFGNTPQVLLTAAMRRSVRPAPL